MDGVEPVEHHGVFVRMRLFRLISQRLRVRTVVNAARMQRGTQPGLDIVLAFEEIAVVIEEMNSMS